MNFFLQQHYFQAASRGNPAIGFIQDRLLNVQRKLAKLQRNSVSTINTNNKNYSVDDESK